MAHVLIGPADAVAAPEALFSLVAAGHRVSAFGPEGTRRALAGLPLARYLPLPDPGRDRAGALAVLEAALEGEDPPQAILPLDDAGLWLTAASPALAALSAGATGAQAELALDKARQLEAAATAGLAVPPTRIVAGPDDLAERALPGIALPAILKPRMAIRPEGDGLTRGRTRYIRTPEDARTAAKEADFASSYLFQPLIPGIGEGVFGFAGPGGVTAWSGHRRVRMMNPHGSGSSACRAIVPDAGLRAAVERFVTAAGWQGPFMVELLRDAEGTPWLMELNGRLWGSLALARRQGLEHPAMAVARVLEPDAPVPEVSARDWPHVQRHLGRDLVHLMMVARGPKTPFHRADWPRFWPALAAVLRPAPRAAFYNHDPAAPRFFLGDAGRTIQRALRRR